MEYRDFLIKRRLPTIPMLIGLLTPIFTFVRVISGRLAWSAPGPRVIDETAWQLHHQMGLDQPIWLQYINCMTGLLRDDLGQFLIPNRNVATDLIQYLPATLELTAVTILIAIIVGVPLGITSGQHGDMASDNLGRLFSFFNVSLPPPWTGILLWLIVIFGPGQFLATGRIDDVSPVSITITGLFLVGNALVWSADAFVSAAQHPTLPALTLPLAPMADTVRMMHSSLAEEHDKDYAEGLQTYGIPNKLIAYRYVLRKSFVPTLTVISLDYGFFLSSAFVIGIISSWPGTASYGVETILQKDMNATVGVTLVVGGSFPFVNFLVDVLYGFLDSRVWHGGE